MAATNEAGADSGAGDADAELDAAILAHDVSRTQYVLRTRAVRRRMAIIAFVIFAAGGAAIIAAGLWSDAVAGRIDKIGNIIVAFMFSLAGVVSAYWGVGAMDNRTMMGGGGMYGGGYGSSGYGGAMARRSIVTAQISSRAD